MKYVVEMDREITSEKREESVLHLPFGLGSRLYSETIEILKWTKDLKLSPEGRDLLDFSTAIFYSDKYCLRGPREQWVRDISLHLSLRNPKAFEEISGELAYLFNLLGGDNLDFVVSQMTTKDLDPYRNVVRKNTPPTFTDIALLSGGQDSAAGALSLLKEKKNPLFVRINTHDKANMGQMRRRLGSASGRQVYLYQQSIVALKGTSPEAEDHWKKESSQRLRSFYFLSIAALFAKSYGVDEIHISENGIMAIHLPLDASRASSFSTRTAYPPYLESFSEIVGKWLQHPTIKVKNRMVLKTKAEVIKESISSGGMDLMADSLSCAHSATVQQTYKRNLTKSELMGGDATDLHCGYCFPCILRRISMWCAGAGSRDVNYLSNPFRTLFDTATSNYQFIHESNSAIFSLIRFVQTVRGKSDEELFRLYPQIAECSVTLGLGDAKEMSDLHRRFIKEVERYINSEHPRLSFLLKKDESKSVGEEIQSTISIEAIEEVLLKAGVDNWSEAVEKEILSAYDESRVRLQVALASGDTTTTKLKNFFGKVVGRIVSSRFPTAKRISLKQSDAREIKKSLLSECVCPPITKA